MLAVNEAFQGPPPWRPLGQAFFPCLSVSVECRARTVTARGGGSHMAAKKQRLSSGFTLGGEQAEADPLLEHSFFASSDYRIMESRVDRRCFVIGRTGAGKSAALQHLEEVRDEHVIRINPEDLSLPYIADLHVIRYLDSLNVNLDLFWIALWKHVLLVEIIRKRYNVSSPVAKQNFLTSLRELVVEDPGKRGTGLSRRVRGPVLVRGGRAGSRDNREVHKPNQWRSAS